METVEKQMEPTRSLHMPMLTALLKLLQQPTRKFLADSGKHRRAGVTKNKMQGESKARRRMAKESRRRNRV